MSINTSVIDSSEFIAVWHTRQSGRPSHPGIYSPANLPDEQNMTIVGRFKTRDEADEALDRAVTSGSNGLPDWNFVGLDGSGHITLAGARVTTGWLLDQSWFWGLNTTKGKVYISTEQLAQLKIWALRYGPSSEGPSMTDDWAELAAEAERILDALLAFKADEAKALFEGADEALRKAEENFRLKLAEAYCVEDIDEAEEMAYEDADQRWLDDNDYADDLLGASTLKKLRDARLFEDEDEQEEDND